MFSNFWGFFQTPTICLPFFGLVVCASGFGAIMAMFEPYLLGTIHATRPQVAQIFLTFGFVYAIISLVGGYVCNLVLNNS